MRGSQCCAYGCKKRQKKVTSESYVRSDSEGSEDEQSVVKRQLPRTFHRFPTDESRKKEWVQCIKRKNWNPSKRSLICSDHFAERSMCRTGKITCLKKDATPTRFKKFPKYLIAKVPVKRRGRAHEVSGSKKPRVKSANQPQVLPAVSVSHDHVYCKQGSPQQVMKRQLNVEHIRVKSLKKRLEAARLRQFRLKKKVKTLYEVIGAMRKKNLISDMCEEVIKRQLSGVPAQLLQRMTQHTSGKGVKYCKELKSFAMTLQYYSTKAYNFVRKNFQLALPHPNVIRRWYGSLPAEPGFTGIAFEAIKAKVASSSNQVVCSLMMDEMSIRKQVLWDGKRYRGYVDLGTHCDDDDSLPLAKDVLVFMAVCVNASWKIPLAYFFTNGLSGQERANLIKICIERISETGAYVASLTCDGPSAHFSMLSALGATISSDGCTVPYFPDPLFPSRKVYVILDPCHMLKLIRNCLAEWGSLQDCNGAAISWSYITKLQKLQVSEGLRLGNKLKRAHIDWKQHKMKVNLAAQTISSSVADAIEYCDKVLQMADFRHSAATVKFLRSFDHLFDILNSRNPFAKGYKAPLRESNQHIWQPFLTEMTEYICNLRDGSGRPILQSRRKTGFLGFLVSIKSTIGLFNDLVLSKSIKYLLMYKFSQDHLELFFCAVRSSGGFNNNPTCEQFTAAYKRLLMRLGIRTSTGNCREQDATSILELMDNFRTNDNGLTLTSASIIRKYDLEERRPLQDEHDYSDIVMITNLSDYKCEVIEYIAGYVAKSLSDRLLCHRCKDSLHTTSLNAGSFLKFKNRGGLTKPSYSVVQTCMEAEKCFQRMLIITSGKLPHCKGLMDAFSIAVLGNVASSLFPELDDHVFDSAIGDNHVVFLIKEITKTYCKIRFKHLGVEYNQNTSDKKIRSVLTKLILFKNQ